MSRGFRALRATAIIWTCESYRNTVALCYNALMELEPDMENVHYIDEYPELAERLRLQRLARPAVTAALRDMTKLLQFERPTPPDGAA